MIDLIGQEFGCLIVIRHKGIKTYNCGTKDHLWVCECQNCGKEHIYSQSYLKSGRASCSCIKSIKLSQTLTKHGGCKTKLYGIWYTMKNRCYNKKNKSYKRYGGRGITVCNEWLNFAQFRDWSIKNGYEENKGLSIDRINNNGNYEPSNCRWVNSFVQANNKRNNHKVIINDNEYSLNQLERLTGMDHRLIGRRLKDGWEINTILETKPIKGRNQNGIPPTTEDIIARIKELYGEDYDCSKVEYKNCDTPICLICKKHGEFWKTPYNLINKKSGCNLCNKENKKKNNK